MEHAQRHDLHTMLCIMANNYLEQEQSLDTTPTQSLIAHAQIEALTSVWNFWSEDNDPDDLFTKWVNDKDGEVTHMAIIQNFGWITNLAESHQAVTARAFTNQSTALSWVSKVVRRAHGDDPQVHTTSHPMTKIDETGIVHEWLSEITVVRTPGGPSWGMIVSCN
jgi:hypothetical protein